MKERKAVGGTPGRAAGGAFVLLLVYGSLALGNGLNLNSLGSRALSMGGAFVGLADDFSAIFWNPAGAAAIRARCLGFYGTDIIPSSTYKTAPAAPGLDFGPPVDARTKTSHYLGGLAAYYLPVSDKLTAGFGVYSPSGLGTKWKGENFAAVTGGEAYEWSSKVGLVTFSPLLACKISDRISAGAALNLNYGMFSVKTHAGFLDGYDLGQYEEAANGWGFGATFGLLVRPGDTISLGLTYRTVSKVRLGGDAKISKLSRIDYPDSSGINRDLTWPAWLAAGIAFRPAPRLTLTADYQWTQWSKVDKLEADFKESVWKSLMSRQGRDVQEMSWSDRAQIRFGAEYAVSGSLTARAGYYRDPSPAPDKTMNVLMPTYDFNVVTLGLGYGLKDLQLDFGVEFLKGAERRVDFLKTRTDPGWKFAMPGIYETSIVVPNLSVSYRF